MTDSRGGHKKPRTITGVGNTRRRVRFGLAACLAGVWMVLALTGSVLAQSKPQPPDRPPAGRPWSFEQCWQAAKENSPLVTVSELAVAEAAVGLEEADKVFFPKVSVATGVTANTVEQSGLGANFQYNLQIEPILEGYEKFLAEDLAQLQYKISQKGREKALAILRYRVSEAYLQLMAHGRAKHHLERAVMLQRRRFNLEELAGGEESRALFRLESQKFLMLEQQRLSELDNAINAWRLKLTGAMSLPPETPVRVDPAEPVRRIVDPEVSAAGDDRDWKQSIQARLSGLELQLVTKQRDLAGLNDLPKPIVRGGWSSGRFDESSGAYVLLGVEIPIWDWGRNDRLKKRLDLRKQREEASLKGRYLAWRTRLAHYRHLLADLERQKQALEQGLALERQAVDILGELARQGDVRTGQILTAEVEAAHKQAQLALLEGQVWVILSQIATANSMGVVDVR